MGSLFLRGLRGDAESQRPDARLQPLPGRGRPPRGRAQGTDESPEEDRTMTAETEGGRSLIWQWLRGAIRLASRRDAEGRLHRLYELNERDAEATRELLKSFGIHARVYRR